MQETLPTPMLAFGTSIPVPARGRRKKSQGDPLKIVSDFVKAQRAITGTKTRLRIEVFVYDMAPHGKSKSNGTRAGNSYRANRRNAQRGEYRKQKRPGAHK